MANGDLNISLILKLVDRVTAPARGAMASLRQIGDVTRPIAKCVQITYVSLISA